MKHILITISTALMLFLSSCDQCGPDVFLGEYKILEESKADWYPYVSTDLIEFENADGVVLEMEVTNRRQEMLEQRYRDICKGRNIEDVTREKYTSERIIVEYTGLKDDVTYFLTATIYVDRFTKDASNKLAVYDRVSYSSRSQNFNEAKNPMIEGNISLVANKRGAPVEHEDLWYESVPHHAESLEISGKTYQDIWYFEEDDLITLYVQEGIGILAFSGFDGEVWVVK